MYFFWGGCLGCENTFSEGIWSRTCCNTRIILQCAPNSLNVLKVKYHLERLCCHYVFFEGIGHFFRTFVGFGMMSNVNSKLPGSDRAKEKDKDKNKQAFRGRFG